MSCWGNRELKQHDVSDPHDFRKAGLVRLGGIVNRNPHRAAPKLLGSTPPDGEVSRDGRRAYFTNSPHASWDEIFYPHGVDTSMARIDRTPNSAAGPGPTVLPAR